MSARDKSRFKKARALLKFLSPEEGGRKKPLVFTSSTFDDFFYHPTAIFDKNTREMWGVVVTDPSGYDDDWRSFSAKIYYVMQGEGAPDELMVKGATFGLYEGKTLVARGTLLSDLE